MDKAVGLLCPSLRLIARDAPDGIAAPTGAYVGKHLGTTGQELHKEHRDAVEAVVLGGKNIRLAGTFPVEGGVEDRLSEIAVGVEIRPLSLSLEAGCQSIVAEPFFLTSGGKIGIAAHEVLDDNSHLDHEFPVFFLLSG